MWSRNVPQTHQKRSIRLEAKPKLKRAAWLFIKGTLKEKTFYIVFNMFCWFYLPKGRENNFLSKSSNPEMQSSNSGRNEKDNRNKDNWQENQYPGHWIKHFHDVPRRGNSRRISREPIQRKIFISMSTKRYSWSSVVATVVSWSYNIYFIPLNLIIWLNHHIQYSVPQTFPKQPVHPPSVSS